MGEKYIPVTFTINNEINDNDTRFLNITIDVLHTGKNFNDSIFEKEIVDSCVESIKNTAILGFIEFNDSTQQYDFKGHEHLLTMTKNGVEEKYLGSAYGVIPESCNPRWIIKMCDDGQEREFLQVDALLWTKFEESTSIINRDIEKSHSMELDISSIEGYEDDDGIFHFTKFKFDGCCLLGDSIDPAMINSVAYIKETQFTVNDIVKSLQNEMNKKYTIFTEMVNKKRGGIDNMANKYFSQTVMNQFEDISNVVRKYETVMDRWGDTVPRYYAVDIQDNEVIVVDRSNNYQYYGIPFTVSGDKPEIDFSNANRKKIRYEKYEEGDAGFEGAFEFGKHISEIEDTAFAKVSEAENKASEAEKDKINAESEYTKMKKDYEHIKPKYDEYVKAEKETKEKEIESAKDAMFKKFEGTLSEDKDFAALKENRDSLSIDDIETKCSILYTRKCMGQKQNNLRQTDFSKKDPDSLEIMDDGDDGDTNFVSTKYGNIPVNR